MTQLRGATPRPAEDPHVRRMLATHMHCGEAMQLVRAEHAPPWARQQETNDGGLLTYRCACGFCFDEPKD